MVKKLITEISEEDFRKLDITVYKQKRVRIDNGYRFEPVPTKLNDILDNEIKLCLDAGYSSNLEELDMPITIAIHEKESEGEDIALSNMYFDKYMNRYTGPTTYYFAWGIKHLYSTRDYYEARDCYWRVRKDETKVIYRVVLDKKWVAEFVLKHKSVVEKEYEEDGGNVKIYANYDLIEESGEWKLTHKNKVIKKGKCTSILPYKEE